MSPGAELFDDVQPISFDEALRRAVAEDSEDSGPAGKASL